MEKASTVKIDKALINIKDIGRKYVIGSEVIHESIGITVDVIVEHITRNQQCFW